MPVEAMSASLAIDSRTGSGFASQAPTFAHVAA